MPLLARPMGIAGFGCGASLVALVLTARSPFGHCWLSIPVLGSGWGGVCFLAEFGFPLGIGWGIDSFGA